MGPTTYRTHKQALGSTMQTENLKFKTIVELFQRAFVEQIIYQINLRLSSDAREKVSGRVACTNDVEC